MFSVAVFSIIIFLQGYYIASTLKGLYFEEKICASIVFGIIVSSFSCFFISHYVSFSIINVLLTSLINLVIIYFLLNKKSVYTKGSLPKEIYFMLLTVFFFTAILTNHIYLYEKEGHFHSAGASWGDLPFHLALITNFSYGDNFPPVYPMFPYKNLNYPFIFDFFSSILLTLGLPLRYAVIFPNILVYLIFSTFIYSFSLRIIGFKRFLILAPFFIFFSGGLQFLYLMCPSTFPIYVNTLELPYKCLLNYENTLIAKNDMNATVWIHNVADSFVKYDFHNKLQFDYLNITWGFLLPQRTFAFAMCIFLLVVILLITGIKRNILFAGILIGLLPRIHAHSFLSLVVFISTLYFIRLFYRFNKKRLLTRLKFAPILFLGVCLAVPSVLNMSSQFKEKSFIRPKIGWELELDKYFKIDDDKLTFTGFSYLNTTVLDSCNDTSHMCLSSLRCETHPCYQAGPKPKDRYTSIYSWLFQNKIISILFYWLKTFNIKALLVFFISALYLELVFVIKNAGFTLLFMVTGFYFASKKYKKIMLSIFPVFLLANLVIFTPWEFDNSKMIILVYIITIPAIILGLSKIYKRNRLVATILIVFSLVSGLLNVFHLFDEQYVLFSQGERQAAAFVKMSTEKNATFLTAPVHNHPIQSLAGRKIVVGYDGWLWSHGFDYGKQRGDLLHLFGLNCDKLTQYDVDYIYLSGHEINYANVHMKPIASRIMALYKPLPSVLEEIYAKDRITIYKLNCP